MILKFVKQGDKGVEELDSFMVHSNPLAVGNEVRIPSGNFKVISFAYNFYGLNDTYMVVVLVEELRA
jgi:hypothetical protein